MTEPNDTPPFTQFELCPELLQSLQAANFHNATPVQAATIPAILADKDIFAQAETGSGKTGSFAIPIIEKILQEEKNQDLDNDKFLYLVLSPTRELAQQTFKTFEEFGSALGIRSVSVIGGESIQKQKDIIQKNVHVVIGTPGRVVDLTKQKEIDLQNIRSIIFDEADRLFDMGFKKEIEYILSRSPKQRQLIMVSATINQDVLRTAYKFHSHPEEICINEDTLLVDNIDHQLAMLSREEKFPFLVNLLRKQDDAYAIVFCNTQIQTHVVAEWLKAMDFKASPISGRLSQNKRTGLMQDFREKKTTILVCTDVAARGLDIKNVNIVINYDLPNEAANYVHRIGRTGRAGEKGLAISLCAHEDCDNLEAIYKLIDGKIPKYPVNDDDFAIDICPKPYVDQKTLMLTSNTNNRQQSRKSKDTHRPLNTKRKHDDKIKPKRQNSRLERQPKNSREDKTMKQDVRTDIPNKKPFVITTNSLEDATLQAKSYFRVPSEAMLQHKILSKGPKKFILFGKQDITFEFTINSPLKEKVIPFVEELIEKMGLNLLASADQRGNSLEVTLKGQDVGLLLTNRKQLLFSLDLVVRQYAQKNIIQARTARIRVNAIGDNPRSSTTKNRPSEDDDFLEGLAEKLKNQTLKSGKPSYTKTLNPAQRRIIHQYLQDAPEVQTNSVGEGRFKKIKISPNQSATSN